MNCPTCDASVPDGSLFCNYCGRSLPKEKMTKGEADDARLEYCEIKYRNVKAAGFTSYPVFRFVAIARGPNGEYVAASSSDFEGSGNGLEKMLGGGEPDTFPQWNDGLNKLAIGSYKELVNLLLRSGWDQTGKNPECWWNDTFRRRVK